MIYKEINYEDLHGDYVLIDVRSKKEYSDFTIPGSVNIPILDDEERARVGTIYINESREVAKRLGVEFVSKKLPELFDKILYYKSKYKKVVLFCERGGMRSNSLFSLMNSLGIEVYKLKGGYKAYRAHVTKMLPIINEKKDYIVLHGFTGTGKTQILKALKDVGMDVLDLEGIANHRGSILGAVGLKRKVSQKQFDAEVFETLKNSIGNSIFIEAESKKIGNIIVPDYIIEKMKQGRHILIQGSINARAKRLVIEYTNTEHSVQELISALDKFEKYISLKRISEYKQMILNNDYYNVAVELMEKYYDPLYSHMQDRYTYDVVIDSDDLDEAVKKLVDTIKLAAL